MSLSLIFIASDKKTENEKTLQCIKQEVEATNRELQLLMYGCKEDLSLLEISEGIEYCLHCFSNLLFLLSNHLVKR